ncbi:MAG: HipA family kinase [Rhodothermales bacterium]
MDAALTLPTYTAIRYVVPLREGGSLPAVLEVEDGGLFVAKFRGAGQGAKTLLAELIVGLLARHAGLSVPEVALIDLDASFGRTERDPEIQDILKGSRGLNVGLRYLDGAFNYDPLAAASFITPAFAADLVWLDAYTTNIDRTPRNPNLLLWDRRVWLIDHGATLYFHHNWDAVDGARLQAPFPPIKNHVLLSLAGDLEEADVRMTSRLDEDVLRQLLALLPDELLMDAPEGQSPPFASAEANRAAYFDYLAGRLQAPHAFLDEAIRAQEAQRQEAPQTLPYRR